MSAGTAYLVPDDVTEERGSDPHGDHEWKCEHDRIRGLERHEVVRRDDPEQTATVHHGDVMNLSLRHLQECVEGKRRGCDLPP
jgi:hypothetical protein